MAIRKGWKSYLPVFFRGMGMGAADVVPGVSGGTIAFITGIYEELIDTIKSFDLSLVNDLIKEGPKAAWKKSNANFLLALFAGIAVSVLSLVRVIHYLLDFHPILIWSFFFGLIVASAIAVGLKIKKWNAVAIILLIAGGGIAYWITQTTPSETPNSLWFIFFSGCLAICAMVLPGISGSFILLLLKKYNYITEAVKNLDLITIAVFMAGCVVGLLSFSKVLSWMFKKYHDATIALMTGFMIGSLGIVWPWKRVIESRLNSHGEMVPFRYESILPQSYEGDSQWLFAGILALIGFALIFILDTMGNKAQKD
jgi:putative membrane protein